MSPHPFSLRQLQYVVAVAETRGFRRAAERCHVSQPSLSAQLAHAEAALGTRLFERNRRRVFLTPAGEELVARARRVLTEADDLLAASRRLKDPLAGTLRMGIIPTVSPYLLPEVVPALRARYPKLTVLWTEGKTDALLEDLHAGRLDALLLARVAGMGDVELETIAEDPFVLAGPVGHPLLGHRRRAKLGELAGASVLLLEDGHCLRDQALSLCTSANAHEGDYRATSLSTLAQMVAGGAGVTLLPALSLSVENRKGRLAIRRFTAPVPSRSLALTWRRLSPLAAGFRKLAVAMREACREAGEVGAA